MRQLRREGNGVPVVLLGSCSEEIDRIVGFEVGADDYVPKPCSPRELLARVRAVARRCGVRFDAMPALLRFGRLEIDEAAREARLDGRDAGLKPREFALLLTMARSPGVAFSRALLLERVWGYDFDGDERTVDVHVRRLRLRVEERPSRPGYVRTVHGYGYKFSADPERASPPRGP
jgi:DNA-binding response OmpR family regulator